MQICKILKNLVKLSYHVSLLLLGLLNFYFICTISKFYILETKSFYKKIANVDILLRDFQRKFTAFKTKNLEKEI